MINKKRLTKRKTKRTAPVIVVGVSLDVIKETRALFNEIMHSGMLDDSKREAFVTLREVFPKYTTISNNWFEGY